MSRINAFSGYLILLDRSPFRQLSPFVHSQSHSMYPETDLGLYARGVIPLPTHTMSLPVSTLRCRSLFLLPLRCLSLLPTQDSNTRSYDNASTNKLRHLVP
nr:hypothetical transcript [Hymenolepis microstoma]